MVQFCIGTWVIFTGIGCLFLWSAFVMGKRAEEGDEREARSYTTRARSKGFRPQADRAGL